MSTVTPNPPEGHIVHTKTMLLTFKTSEPCIAPPLDLPDMTIVKGPKRHSLGPKPNKQKQWLRQPLKPRDTGRFLKASPSRLVGRSPNAWRPSAKSATPLEEVEKQVKGLLNKMTKDKFYTLSAQMCEIEFQGDDMLAVMIDTIHQKAANEPAFGDMYADLCFQLKGSGQAKPFKRALLNKCEKEFAQAKTKLMETQLAASEGGEEMELRCIKAKKQMLGNIKFIGQLYKKCLLKERIIKCCIGSLLKLEEDLQAEYKDSGNADIDLEDHEAICSIFTTIGSTIDKPPASGFMWICFAKIEKFSLDKENMPARTRFMYKDLLELRENNWVPRRDEGKAKTLPEIRKDFEQEEKKRAQQSVQNNQQSGRNNKNKKNHTHGGNQGHKNKKPQRTAGDDGFTAIVRGHRKDSTKH